MPNRLIHETSPYLRQHAENPVDWYPWGDEAFAEAKRRNVPVLLSIGYSACHWCHVMERESFANPVIAARINSLFVPVKVDREERPDVDEVYMRAVQAFNRGQGGWPMTVFLTPDRQPFFGGTYFPPVARGSLPSFTEVLGQVGDVWRKHPGEVARITQDVARLYEESARARPSPRLLARDWLQQVASGVAEDFDPINGGFGDSPKFPPHGTLAVLLAHHRRTGDPHSLHMVTATLDGMAKGGMYDLAGGGFARYSVDAEWRVPHFEKMLYDTAQLVPVYLDAWKVTKDAQYARIVRESVGFLLREFLLAEGGFAASLDADSMVGGSFTEGGYYTFTAEEVREALGADATRACVLLEVTSVGTAEDGRSVLRTLEPMEHMPEAERAFLDGVLPKLRAAREQRQPPHRDDKRILSWNALAISALAQASALDGAWLEPAVKAAQFLVQNMRVDGGWRRTWLDGSASRQNAFADDHANLLLAFLDLYEATFDAPWLTEAGAVADAIVARFWDEATGTLFTTAHGEPALLSRGRPSIGGAEPSAVGAAALGFVRLSKLVGRSDLEERASSLLRSIQFALSRGVRALGQEALAGAWLADGGAEVAIVGAPDGEDTRALLAEVRQRYLPFTVVARIGPDGQPALPWVEGKTPIGGRATAYVCEGFSCLLPTPDPAVLAAQLEERMQQPAASSDTRVPAPDLPSAPEVWLNTHAPPTLERLRGHVVVLDFWTYCCVNCMHVLPELAAIEQRYVGQPVTVIGIHCAKFPTEQTIEGVRAAIERYGVRHPVLNDPDHAVWDEYAVRSWPTLVVLDTSGRIAHQRGGEVDRADLAALIDQLLEEGRAAGTLAAGPLPSPAVPPASRAAPEGQVALRFPGRVHVWPDAFEQESGVDVFGSDRSARVYVTDTGNHRILECTLGLDDEAWPYLVVQRTFGSGQPGLVDGAGATAAFRGPQGTRRFGSVLYIADTENHAVRTVDLIDGTVRTLAGNGTRGAAAPTVDEMAQPGALPLRSPWDVEVMAMRNHHLVFVAMAGSHQIWVYGGGHVGLHTGSGREDHIDGPASQAALAQPSGLAQLGRYLLFVDAETSSIRAVDLQSHQVLTVMGRGLFDFGDRDGPSDVARMQHPLALTYAEDLIYVADTLNHKVKSVALNDGHTKTVVGGTRDVLNEPGGIARAGGTLLVADTNNHRLRAVDPQNGEIRDLPVYLRDPRGA